MSSEWRVLIRFLHKERVHPAQIHRSLEAQYGLKTSGPRSVQHWSQLFGCGRQKLNGDPKAETPLVDHIDAKILVCLKGEPFSSISAPDEALDTSRQEF
jgi:hypothetical protein